MVVDQANELLTVREAATALKVSTVTISRYLKQGRLRAYHLGPRTLRLKREDVQRLLQPVPEEVRSIRHERLMITPPSKDEVARRQTLLNEILALREQADITPLAALVYALVLVRYAGRSQEQRDTAWPLRPWYRRKSTPSFPDMLAALRRDAWQLSISTSTPPSPRRRPNNSSPHWPDALLATA
jgi:excisionase family DNA binding protein